jgi:hypothetical protein
MEFLMTILTLAVFGVPFVATIVFLLDKKRHKKMYWVSSSIYNDGGSHGFGGHGHHDGGHH